MSKDTFGYAIFTIQTGHRPISAFAEVFEQLANSLVSQFDAVEKESGSTKRQGLHIALSDTAILMTYSLVEGFFFEEYKFYFEKEPPRGEKLEESIRSLLSHIGSPVDDRMEKGLSQLPVLRAARNAIAHRNGQLKEAEKSEIQKHFGAEMSTRQGYPIADILLLFTIIQSASQLISGFSFAAVDAATAAQQSVPGDVPASAASPLRPGRA